MPKTQQGERGVSQGALCAGVHRKAQIITAQKATNKRYILVAVVGLRNEPRRYETTAKKREK